MTSQGGTFTVELELPAAAESNPAADASDRDAKAETFSLDGQHILAAEDNELNAEILTELLGMEGAFCRICEDGRKMVEEFEHSEPGTYVAKPVDMAVLKKTIGKVLKKKKEG